MAASSLSWAIGQGVWCYYDLVRRIPVPFPSWADVGYLAAVPLAVVGLLSFPGPGWRATSRFRALMDGLLIAGSLLFVSWAMVLGPIYGTHKGGILKQVLSMSYPASDVVLVSLVVVLALRTGGAGRTSLLLVMAGIVAFSVSDSSFAYLTEVNNYGVGGVLDTGWVAGYLLIVLGALWSMATPSLPAPGEGTGRVTRFSVLAPYALPALAGAVAVARLAEGHAFGLFLALEGFVLLALLGTRQIVTLLDNVALNGLLHTKIQLGTAELRQREARFSALAEHASDLITIVGEDSLIHYQSPSILRTLGRDPDQLLGTRFDLLLHPQDRSRWLAVVGRLGTEPQGVVTAEWRLRHRDDTWRTFQSAVTNLVGETSVAGYVVNSRDITDQRGLEDQLRDRALHDALTGLANRALFAEHLERASRRQHRSGGSVQVMIIDLDDFGAINEEFGHAAGDELLTKVALRLQTSLRDADSIGRLGGDEFGVLFEFPGSPPPGTPADRVVMSFSKPFTVRGQQVRVTSSIGIAANASDCRSEGELMRRADLALHAAKAQGKQTHVVYAPELHGSKLDGVRLDRELRQALERGEFELHYQPIVHIETGDITGVEALIRWNSPKRGPVSPLEFIPEAESSGLIRPIGEWVIREACRETRDWRDGSGAPLRVSVNVSPQQLRAAQFPGTVLGIVAELAYDPRRLTLEVTETLFAGDATLRSELLAELRSSGMRVAIDDFGTGYSSLSLLRDLPVDVLKIDKSFIDHIIDEPESARVVRTILRLAEDFHLSTVAEGVEDRDQLALLRLWGCHFVQGFYFSRPLGSHAMERVLLQERPFDVLFEQPAELIGR